MQTPQHCTQHGACTGDHTCTLQDFNNEEQGDALYAMSIALALEKLNFEKITALSEVAEESGDAQMADFLDEMLQVRAHASRSCMHCLNQVAARA